MAAHRAGQHGREGRGLRDGREGGVPGQARRGGPGDAGSTTGEAVRGDSAGLGGPAVHGSGPDAYGPAAYGSSGAYRGSGGYGSGAHGGSGGPGAYGSGAYAVPSVHEGPGAFGPGGYGLRGALGGSAEQGSAHLVRICDLAGRPRGAGFLADADGTLLTSHEAVDGLARVVLHAPGGQVCLAEADAVTPLPELGLALVATEGLGVPPLPVAPHAPAHPERRFTLRLPHPAEGTLLGAGPATYTATDRYHLLPEVYELALAGDASVPPQASGAPLVDCATGAVLAVLATALQSGHRAAGFAIPLRAQGAPAPLAALLARNAATVPAYGLHLNLAGALRLTDATVGTATGPGPWREPVERPELAHAFREFLDADGPCPPLVLGLAGPPGSGRSTELARLAARRARGPHPAPTLWLRGADLRPGDGGVKDAVERALRGAARIVAAAGATTGPAGPGDPAVTADLGDPAHTVAALAAGAERPLLILLDAPEEMSPALSHALADWTAGTAWWLRASGARLIVACGPEFWEQAGALLPRELLYAAGESGAGRVAAGGRGRSWAVSVPDPGVGSGGGRGDDGYGFAAGRAAGDAGVRDEALSDAEAGDDVPPRGAAGAGGAARSGRGDSAGPGRGVRVPHRPAAAVDRFGDAVRDLPPCLRIGDLDAEQAAQARSRHGLRAADLAPGDAGHPLVLRLLSEVRAALPEPADPDLGAAPVRPPTRAEVFSAYLDLMCLRIAERLAAASEPPLLGTSVRRLATRAAGRVHQAARRCLGPGQGELDREAFEDVFPWRTGWASAVLAEGLFVPAGAGYRFAHEEWADWIQSLHLDVPVALEALVHRWFAAESRAEAPVRLPSRPGAQAAGDRPPPVPPAPAVAAPEPPRCLPVPRHRAAPVVQALVLTPPAALTPHLLRLVAALDHTTPHPTRCTPQPAAGASTRGQGARGGLATFAEPAPPGVEGTVPLPGEAPGYCAGTAGRWGRAAGAAEEPRVAHGAPGAAAGPDDGPRDAGGRGPDAVPGQHPEEPAQGARRAGHPGAGPADVPTAYPGGRTLVPSGAELLDSEADTVPNPRTRRAARPDQAPLARTPDRPAAAAEPVDVRRCEAAWWAAHLLRETLLRTPDATPHRDVLRALAERIVVRSVEGGGFTALPPGGLAAFGPAFWRALALPAADRLDFLRLLLPADPAPPVSRGAGRRPVPDGSAGASPYAEGVRGRVPARFLGAAADVAGEAAGEGLRAVCGWLDDDRPLQGAPRLTVASAAQALLHTHRRLAVDDLTEALVAAGHPGADAVLAALAEDEPSAVCRAVDRWAHDERPARHVAAAAYGARAAGHVRSAADRELLRYAALALLARSDDASLHGAALGLLVRDPGTRSRHLPAAVRAFAEGDRALPAAALAAALPTHPEPVLAAFQNRLRDRRTDAGEVLAELARPAAPALSRRAAVLVADLLRHRPDQAPAVARYLDLRLEQGPAARTVLLPLTDALLREHPVAVRAVLAPVFAAPGSHMSRPLRQELLDVLLAAERDPDVLDALLCAAADGARQRHPLLTRDLVHRVGLLLGRTAQGAACFDRRIVRLAAAAPEFAGLVQEWLADGGSWDAVIGPSARRRLEECAGPGPAARAKPDVLRTTT